MVKAIGTGNGDWLPEDTKDVLDDVLVLFSQFQYFSCIWRRRQNLLKAHMLAKWALNSAGIYQPPDFILDCMYNLNLFKF